MNKQDSSDAVFIQVFSLKKKTCCAYFCLRLYFKETLIFGINLGCTIILHRAFVSVSIESISTLYAILSIFSCYLFYFVTICLQLGCMVRDMSVDVRLVAFEALGKIGLVSEDILLQTLSKKVLGINKDKVYKPIEGLGISASAVAGAYIHGLEDEFSEVKFCRFCS